MSGHSSNSSETHYFWRVRTRLPERFHHRCRVLVRGKMNTALVEFDDGYRVVTSRNYYRRWPPPYTDRRS